MALEIQHASDAILQRVNRFFGWERGSAGWRCGQAPLVRAGNPPKSSGAPDAAAVAEIAENPCRRSRTRNCGPHWARLGASIKRN